MRTRGLVAIAVLASILPTQEVQTPRFRVAVDAVRIDAVVTDANGNIVRDLTADDFEILQDGKTQNVTDSADGPARQYPAHARAGHRRPRRVGRESVLRQARTTPTA